MRKLFAIVLACLLGLSAFAQDYPELGAKLEEYFTALAGESAAVQASECDYLIESCNDSLVRQYVALKIYDHYLKSRILGDDAVAVHVADKWLLSGRVPMHNAEELAAADVYATFNRNSLIGKQAPATTILDDSGATVRVPVPGEYTVLYFYAPGCGTCKAQTLALKELVASGDYPFRLVSVNVNEQADDSSWQLDYGVLKTPWMFLISPSGVILGRGLDISALRMLLAREFASDNYEYGAESQMERFDQMFAAYGDTLKASHVLDVADYMAARTFGEGNIDSFKQVEGDLLYYMAARRDEALKDAVIPFAAKYLEVPDVWTSHEDSLQVLSLGKFLCELTARTPVGSVVPALEVYGTLRRKPCLFVRGSRTKVFNLAKLRGKPAYVVFYTGGCGSCAQTLEEVSALVTSRPRVRVLLVDMDALMADYPDMAGQLLDTFDLTVMPYIIELDRKGVITHRYVDLSKVK